MPDPLYNHPIFPAGFNADDNNGDEVDGAGTNWAVWPYLFDSFIPLEVLIITPEMMEIFEGCADFVAPSINDNIPVPLETNIYTLKARPNETKIAAEDTNLLVSAGSYFILLPPEEHTLVVPGVSDKKAA